MSRLGVFVSGSQVEASVKSLLETWMHTYLGHAERTLGYPVYPAMGHIPRPRSYSRTAGDALHVPDRQLPRIVIQSPGWVTAPQHDGRYVIATWAVNVLGFWKGHNADETQDMVRDVAAMVVLMLEHKTPAVADSCDVLDVNYDAVPAERERTLAGFEVIAAVKVSQVADRFSGVDDPVPEPTDEPDEPPDYGDPVIVTDTDVTVENTPVNEEVGS